jgi:hypothetical protein
VIDDNIYRSWNRTTPIDGDDDRPIVSYMKIGGPVEYAVRSAAEAALAVACSDLSLTRPKLLWFGRTLGEKEAAYLRRQGVATFKHPEIRGIAHRDAHAIGVRGDPYASPLDVAETVAHECRHLAQRAGGDYWTVDEPEAVIYGEKIRRVLEDYALLHEYEHSPAIHKRANLSPGRANHLYDVAQRGDLLIGCDRGGARKVFVNVGSRASPSWHPLPGA